MLYVGLFLMMFSLVWVFPAVLFCALYKKQHGYTGITEAEVLDIVRVPSGKSASWRPVYFYTVDGVEYTRRPNFSVDKGQCPKVGEIVTIQYDEFNPMNISTGGGKGFKVLAIVFSLIAGVFFCIGLILTVIGALI